MEAVIGVFDPDSALQWFADAEKEEQMAVKKAVTKKKPAKKAPAKKKATKKKSVKAKAE